MGPKVDAAGRFVEATGNAAAIGALKDLSAIPAGKVGTTISAAASDIEWRPNFLGLGTP